ncbi:hypothetical protein HYDPIDRAFT_106255 [Hydnomerulius pinastri MD-312]|nr:hypothetical protein HYDPIDRAFT_106255 [Hydnomerulius pinastri MD-312]
MSMLMHMKGHNGYSPCRMCKITGVPIPNSNNKTLYVPLSRYTHPLAQASESAIKTYDPLHLPMRSHSELISQGREVQSARSAAAAERLAKKYGIKGVPLLSYLSSLRFPMSFPYDFMHLIWENVLKNLISLWTGAFKGIDTGREAYELESSVWTAICEATGASGSTLPSTYCSRPPNPETECLACKADTWSFWTQYLGPVLLRQRFSKPKYYKHFVKLVKMIRVCLQFELSTTDVEDLRIGFASWVKEYEDIYYQHDPQRLPTCTVTIHGLLHIADSIEMTGPVWTSWAFPMERFCGRLQPAIKSRRRPDACLARYVGEEAQLTHIGLIHHMTEELALCRPAKDQVLGELRDKSYPTCALLPPRRAGAAAIDQSMLLKILKALATRFDVPLATVKRHVSHADVEQWGKVRRLDGGDTMLAAELAQVQPDSRDATFIRYEALVDRHARQRNAPSVFEKKTFYGRLQHIFLVRVPTEPALGITSATTIFLAAIAPCQLESTPSHLTSLDIHFYSTVGTTLDIVDIVCLQCLVGRIPIDGGRWALIDRSGSLARAEFAE